MPILALYYRGFRSNGTQLVGLLENHLPFQFNKHLLSAYSVLSIILDPRDKVINKTNIVLLSRNPKMKASVFTFSIYLLPLYGMELFNYKCAVDVL